MRTLNKFKHIYEFEGFDYFPLIISTPMSR